MLLLLFSKLLFTFTQKEIITYFLNFFFIYLPKNRNLQKMSLYSFKVEILSKRKILEPFIKIHKKSRKVFYIYQNISYVYLKTGISKIFLYSLKTEITKNSFMSLEICLFSKRYNIFLLYSARPCFSCSGRFLYCLGPYYCFLFFSSLERCWYLSRAFFRNLSLLFW